MPFFSIFNTEFCILGSRKINSNLVKKVMTEVTKYIYEQIDNLLDYKNSKPKSVVIFGIQKHEIIKLYKDISEYFNKIKNKLHEERNIEKSNLFEKKYKRDINKYENLIEIYKETDKSEYIYNLMGEVCDEGRIIIENTETELKSITDNLKLINFDVYEYFNKMKRKEILEDILDFSNIMIYDDLKDKFLYNKLSNEEKEYIELREYEIKHLSKYVYIHNFYENKKTGKTLMQLMCGIFKWDYLKWSIICIEPNNEFWKKNKDEKLKFEVYYNREIFDLAEKITPIENRLKTELENAGILYEFQYPIDNKYILDFFIQNENVKLNVECDGKEFHSSFEAIEYDNKRNFFMQSKGFKVIRFPGVVIWNNPKSCVEEIVKLLNE